jgi:endonuclease YncB( thermonuclease family)
MSLLLSKPMIYAGLAVVFMVALSIVARNWSCRKSWIDRAADRREERAQRAVTCKVIQVIDGARLVVAWGRRDRLEREVVLQGVEVPASVADESRANLERMTAGGSVTVHYESHRLFAASESEATIREAEMDATAPIVGLVYGDGNRCLNIDQLFAGLAKCGTDANDVMKAAEKAARKSKVGIWK